MLVYLLKSALLLALLYGGFALLLSRETFHRFNRAALLSVLVASMVLPALQLTMNKPSFLSLTPTRPLPRPLPREGGEKREGNFEGVITIEDESSLFSTHSAPSLTGCQEARTECSGWTGSGGESEESSESTSLDWKQVLTLLYLVGVLASVGIFLVQLFRFWRETKDGTRTRDDEGNTVIIRSGNFSPYSFFHTIVINVSDYEHLREPILAHEQAHIRLGHSWDLLLLEAVKAVQWFNPFVYLLGRDLKAVHEYEADNAVLNLGIDAKTYQLLLVTKAVGNRLQTLGNNLSHHSLKKRIKMMHKNSSNRWLMTKAVVLPALMALAVVAFAKPKTELLPVQEELEESSNYHSYKLDFSKNTTAASSARKAVEFDPSILRIDGKPFTSASGNWLKDIDLDNVIITEDAEGNIVRMDLHSKSDIKTAKTDTKKLISISKDGTAFVVYTPKGTWVEKSVEGKKSSYIEERPVNYYPTFLDTKTTKVKLNGKEVDVHSLTDKPCTILTKLETYFPEHEINLITTPVQIPADVKGNINPELTILLTGTPPKNAKIRSSIYVKEGIHRSFDWKKYQYTSWTAQSDNISHHLENLSSKENYHVLINVCKGVSQEQIDRLKNIMREKGVLKFDIVRQ